MRFADKKNDRIVTKPELAAIVALFLFVFYFLFPDKEKLYHQLLLSETSNYDLTAAYLKNIARLEKNDDRYLYHLAKVLIGQGKYDLAEVTIKTLESAGSSRKMKIKAMLLHYTLLVHEYYATSDHRLRRKIFRSMVALLDRLMKPQNLNGLTYTDLKELDDMRHPLLAEKILYMKLLKGDPDKKSAIRLHAFAILLKDTKMVKWSEKYIAEHFPQTIQKSDRETIEKQLSALAESYRKRHDIGRIVSLWLDAYKSFQDTAYVFKAIETYMGAGDYNQAVALTRRYENLLIKRPADAEKVIDIYLQSNAVADAKRVSQKLIGRMRRAPGH